MSLLRKYVRNLLRETRKLKPIRENFTSHSHEPRVGDGVVNINPGCKHYRSEGVVIQVADLPGDMGKIIKYQTVNGGPNWQAGDILEKTPDQLGPGG
jgi:hypothetical protein